MGKKLGNLIKSARADAGFTQEQLAKKVKGVTASDIGRYERGEAEPTAQVVKEIAKACGVTQKSLLDAMPKTASRTSSSGRSGSSGSSSSSSSASSSTAKSTMRVSATEKRLVEAYRAADSETRKKALAILRGNDDAGGLLPGVDDVLAGLGDILVDVLKKK